MTWEITAVLVWKKILPKKLFSTVTFLKKVIRKMEEVEAGLTLFLDMPNLLYLKAKEKKKTSFSEAKPAGLWHISTQGCKTGSLHGDHCISPFISVTPMQTHTDLPTAPSSQPLHPHNGFDLAFARLMESLVVYLSKRRIFKLSHILGWVWYLAYPCK